MSVDLTWIGGESEETFSGFLLCDGQVSVGVNIVLLPGEHHCTLRGHSFKHISVKASVNKLGA